MINALSQVNGLPKLTIAQRRIANHNEFQFYVLCGTNPGPWVKVGINDSEYLIGFLPQKQRRPKSTATRPTPLS